MKTIIALFTATLIFVFVSGFLKGCNEASGAEIVIPRARFAPVAIKISPPRRILWRAPLKITDALAIRAIIGEAEGEGKRGMLAVACALRNRGTLRGVYGLKSPRLTSGRVSPKVRRMAVQAWKESKYRDITGGADHWHNVKREGQTYWTKKFKRTVVIGNHHFFKPTKSKRRK